jgi:uncharacterized membrane protein
MARETQIRIQIRRKAGRLGSNRYGVLAVHRYTNSNCFGLVWMIANVIGFIYHWDVYPFILLNLVFSTQAAYAAPIIMMAQNRQSERDRYHAEPDFETNVEAKKEIEQLLKKLNTIEIEKLDKIMELLQLAVGEKNKTAYKVATSL